jgi:Xaa-Pro aminopeptidase
VSEEKLAVVGFDGLAMKALADAGVDTIDGWPIMLNITKTKTEDEINCIKMAYAITDAAWFKTWELLRPGVTDLEVSAAAMYAAKCAGAEELSRGHLLSGPLTYDRAFYNTGRIVQYGDLVYAAYCGMKYMGYNTCYYRTFSVGHEPNEKVKSWYQELIERINSVIEEIKPGRTTADAAKKFAPASHFGYQEEAELLTMEIGHGLGMYNYGYPIVNRQFSIEHPQEFEVGMTLAVEGRVGAPGQGGVRIEDAVVITESGPELMDWWPRDEILVAPFR